MSLEFVAIRSGLGALLLATASLKLYGLNALAPSGWLTQPWIQLLTAEWELVLGAWLVSGAYPRLSRIMALLTFLLFAGVSGYLGWMGVASCGCLGAIKTNPWWIFGVDIATVALLAVSRSSATDAPQHYCTVRSWVSSVALTSAIGIGATSLYFGSVEVAFAKIRGETITLSPSFVDFGTAKRGDILKSTATISNWTDYPVRLIGGTTDCTCVIVEDFPLTIPAKENATFRLRLTNSGESSGRLTRAVIVRTDNSTRPTIRFNVGCWIVQ